MFARNKINFLLVSFLLTAPFSSFSQSDAVQVNQTDATPPTINILSRIQQMEIENSVKKRMEALIPVEKVVEIAPPTPKPVVIPENKSKKILAIYGKKSKQFVEILLPNGYIIAVNAGFKNKEFEIKKIDDGEIIIELPPKNHSNKSKNKINKKNPEILVLSPGDFFV